MYQPEDISPQAKPLTAKIREDLSRGDPGYSIEAVTVVSEYLDLAKRALLENRVRDFSAADVVAVASIMESRDRDYMKRRIESKATDISI